MIDTKNVVLVPPPSQGSLFHVEKQIEIDGVEMGVLENGIPYLTESGLARMCGIDRKVLNRLAINWDSEKSKPRGKQILQLLEQSGYQEDGLYLKSEHKGGEAYWKDNGLESSHGERVQYEHDYPLYYPQSKSNPQPAYAYPDSCLGLFRAWLRQSYITVKFPNYLLGQTKKGTVPTLIANKALEAFAPKQLSSHP